MHQRTQDCSLLASTVCRGPEAGLNAALPAPTVGARDTGCPTLSMSCAANVACRYEGPNSTNPLAFRYYNAEEKILGKKMKDW